MAVSAKEPITYYTAYGSMPSSDFEQVDDGVYESNVYVTTSIELTEDLLPTLTADGYIFQGWYATSTFEDDAKVEVGDSGSSLGYSLNTGTYCLYAKWSTPTVAYRMTNLANEIRTISGTTDLLSLAEMKDKVNEANVEVASQSDLMTQIMAALNGKGLANSGAVNVECAIMDYNGLYAVGYMTINENNEIVYQYVSDLNTNNYYHIQCLNNSMVFLHHYCSEEEYIRENTRCSLIAASESTGGWSLIHVHCDNDAQIAYYYVTTGGGPV